MAMSPHFLLLTTFRQTIQQTQIHYLSNCRALHVIVTVCCVMFSYSARVSVPNIYAALQLHGHGWYFWSLLFGVSHKSSMGKMSSETLARTPMSSAWGCLVQICVRHVIIWRHRHVTSYKQVEDWIENSIMIRDSCQEMKLSYYITCGK